jgi:hypothetical protein
MNVRPPVTFSMARNMPVALPSLYFAMMRFGARHPEGRRPAGPARPPPVLIPISAGTCGHRTHSAAALWQDHLAGLLKRTRA